MTDEEINKKFDVVAGHLATLAVSQQKYEERWARTEESIRNLLAIAEIHDREMESLKETTRATDERLNALINTVERYISGRRNGGGGSPGAQQ